MPSSDTVHNNFSTYIANYRRAFYRPVSEDLNLSFENIAFSRVLGVLLNWAVKLSYIKSFFLSYRGLRGYLCLYTHCALCCFVDAV